MKVHSFQRKYKNLNRVSLLASENIYSFLDYSMLQSPKERTATLHQSHISKNEHICMSREKVINICSYFSFKISNGENLTPSMPQLVIHYSCYYYPHL